MYMGYHPCLGIHVPCLIHDTALGSMYLMIRIHVPCIWPYLLTLGSMPFFWIHVLHWDTCHYIGICDNASGDDKDATSSQLPHGLLQEIIPTQLDYYFHVRHSLYFIYSHMGIIEVVEGGYRWLQWLQVVVALVITHYIILLRSA
jgi:hypothetical protein